MIKKLNTALVILCILLTLSACGDKVPTSPDTSGGTSEELTSNAMSETTSAEESEEPTESSAQEETSSTTGAAASSQAASSTKAAGTTSKTNSTAPTSSASSSKPADPPPVIPDPPVISNAKSTDGAVIANKIVEYINQYRIAQGTGAAAKLPGLTQVAEYRSRQLVADYKHDTFALREATKFYKYGEHKVYEEYGLDFYECHAGEAIGRSGGNASVDEIAQRMATGFKDSAAHWSYVGAARNKYIAIGATYGNGQWYICILTSEVNTYG